MKRKLLSMVMMAAALGAPAVNTVTVTFSSHDFAGVAQNKSLTITPTSTPIVVGDDIITGGPVTATPTNGAASVALVPHSYRVTWSGLSSPVTILVPSTNVALNAGSLIVVGTNSTSNASVAYSAAASDARFMLKGDAVTNYSSSLTLTGSPAILTLQSTVEGDPVSASLSLDDIGDLTMLASGAVTIGPGDVYLGGSLYGNSFSGAFSGDGSSLTNLPVAAPVLSDAAGVPTPQTLALTLAGSHTGVVHPNVLALSTNWQGYQYWLAITGAGTNADGRSFEDNEQPHIFASRDLVNWEAKGSQPLIARYTGTALCGWGSNGWLADPEIYLDPAGTLRVLYCAFRNLAANQFSNAVLCASSPDGTNWTHEVLHYAPAGTNATYAGPQIVRDHTNGLRLYYVDEGNNLGGTNKLFWVAGLDTSGTNWDWAATNTCSLTTYQDSRYAPWHFSIACVDGTYHLVYGSQSASLGEYSTSTNGTTWSAPGMGVFERQGLLKGSEYTTYKSAMWPVAGPNGLAWNALVGTAPLYAGDATGWRVKLLRGLTIDPQSLTYTSGNTNWTLIGADKVYGAINRMGPFVVSDRTYGTSGGLVALGQPFNGWGGIALGYNSPMAATNYAIASEGFSVRVNAKTGGTVNLGVNNAVRVTASDTLLSATVPTFVPALVVTNATGEDYVLRANSGGVSVGTAYNLSAATISAGSVSSGDVIASGTFTGNGRGITNLVLTDGVRMTNAQMYGTSSTPLIVVATNAVSIGGWSFPSSGIFSHPYGYLTYDAASASQPKYFFVTAVSGTDLRLGAGSGQAVRINAATRNVLISSDANLTNAAHPLVVRGNAAVSGTLFVTNSLVLSSNAAPSATGGAGTIYATSETTNSAVTGIFAMGSDGVATLISPHAGDAPPALYDGARGGMKELIVREECPYVPGGRVRWISKVREATLVEWQTLALRQLFGLTNSTTTNAVAKLLGLSAAQRQVIMSESFEEYYQRTGVRLTPRRWEEDFPDTAKPAWLTQ